MRLNSECKIHLASAKEDGRYAMNCVHLVHKDGRAYVEATNGRILARVPVETDAEDFEADVLLERDAFVEAYRGGAKAERTMHYNGNGAAVLKRGNVEATAKRVIGEYPRLDTVIEPRNPERLLAFDVGYLVDLAKAIGASHVELSIPEFDDGCVRGPIRVEAIDDDGKRSGSFGVIMPITIDSKD